MLLIDINNCAAEGRQLRPFNTMQLTHCHHKLIMRTTIVQNDKARSILSTLFLRGILHHYPKSLLPLVLQNWDILQYTL